MDSLTELFCQVEDFCRVFEPVWEQRLLSRGMKKRRRRSALSVSELMSLVIVFHQLRCRQFKRFYLDYVCRYLRSELPTLPSYPRGIELLPRCAVPLAAWFERLQGHCDGISIADATALAVGENKRIARHQVFKGVAARGKTAMRWFYGFKLHTLINSKGELIGLKLTPGNVDDRTPMPELGQGLFGHLFADKGYIARWLSEALAAQGLHLITTLKKNMKPLDYTAFEQALLRRRALIETVFDELKNLGQIEHTRQRCVFNFIVNLMAGVIAYWLA
ncbi:MAG TPA: IS982 family transposase, partial [Nitrososphaera sp.]|nr:IS982 family transposase [Nitrososphaera sp.]